MSTTENGEMSKSTLPMSVFEPFEYEPKKEPYVSTDYSPGVLIGNWVEDRIECPKSGTLYFPARETVDYDKLKPELRRLDFRQNKLNSLEGDVNAVIRHDSHVGCGNFATTNDLVYNHMPKPLCGPNQRHYHKSSHQFRPQPDMLKCFGNLTEWGLRTYKNYEWACNNVFDYQSTLYEDTFTAPSLSQYLKAAERKARDSSFTSTFRFSMKKPLKTEKRKK